MQDCSFNLIFATHGSDPLNEQLRRREYYQAVSRAWSERRREYLRQLGLRRMDARVNASADAATDR